MYCRREMVKILKCYLIPKKVMALCLRVQFFLANPVQRNAQYGELNQPLCDYQLGLSSKFNASLMPVLGITLLFLW